ncbi:YfjI family protein [Pararhodobacter sp.]|uniref:YfjI family protein n=1 Tax=Pararhodobacter sp. TaxID=2127056 RepID=UPI002AFDFA11|nr:YfjI family protein [Pararhodobacter sp.]
MSEPIPLRPFAAPAPEPLVRDIEAGETFPVAHLGPLAEIAHAIHDVTEAPLALCAQSSLGAAALCVQPHANVELLAGGAAPCSLFLLTVAESGERKSTADRLALRGLHAYTREQDKTYKEERTPYDIRRATWEARKKALTAASARGGDKGEAAAAELELLAAEEPFPPLVPTRIVGEPTLEGVMKLFIEGHPSLGLFSDEAGAFLGGHAMSADHRLKTLAGLSKCWDGDPLTRSRAGDGTVTMFGRRLSLHLMAQPVAMAPLLADPVAGGQGFLARCLIAAPTTTAGTRLKLEHDPASDRIIANFAAKVESLMAAHMPTGDDRQELTPRTLPLSRQAREVLQVYYMATEKAQAPGGDLAEVRAHASKTCEQACRLAGVMTLWGDLNAPEITGATMADAVQLASYYLNEAVRLCDAAVVSAGTMQAEALRVWLMEKWAGDTVTPRDILRRGPNSLREKAKLRAPIGMLVEAGWLVPLETGREAYRVVRT